MCLKKRKVISDKVEEVQSTFDVGDFKHPDRSSSDVKKNNTAQMKLVIGY